AFEDLLQPLHPFLVALQRAPAAYRLQRHPWPEAHEPAGCINVSQEPGIGLETLAMTPFDPLTPAPNELLLQARPHLPDGERVRLRHWLMLAKRRVPWMRLPSRLRKQHALFWARQRCFQTWRSRVFSNPCFGGTL